MPSPPEAMLLNQDCTHLNEAGYNAIVQNLWDEFYGEFFNLIFEDGFESGDPTAGSGSVP